MRKPASSYADMIDLPDDPVSAPATPTRKDEHTPIQSYERTDSMKLSPAEGETSSGSDRPKVKARAKVDTPRPTRRSKESAVPSRREAARLRRMEPKPEPADYIQRSLYAREETFERFRELAFKSKKAQQALYREGLFLVLQKYGAADGLTADDM